MKHIITSLVLATVLTSAGCPGQPNDPPIGAQVETAKTAVALDWLRSNRNGSALATNRFGPTSSAIEFVEQLFAAGATQVYVVSRFNEPERIAAEGGPYADELVVQLPSNPDQRSRLFKIIATETAAEGFDPPLDTGQSTETLWWD
jgi:hypothetical protein